MKTDVLKALFRGLLAATGIGCAVTVAMAAPAAPTASSAAPAAAIASAMRIGAAPVSAEVTRGAYLARAGDCIACHTARKGQPYAGGLAINTPMGAIYATNITPDVKTGIGSWSYDDFAALMRYGKTKEGYTVYPAMPYPSYSRMTDADMHDLYAYLMQGVAPVQQANRASDIPWPLSLRFPLVIWRWLFAPTPQPFTAPANASVDMARGAYLVEGLGHCGSCHTARGAALQEKALTNADGAVYLAGGGAIDGWIAPSLRNDSTGGLADWSEADIATFLKSGRNHQSASFGAMNDVIVDSTQYLSDADLHSIATYLKSLPPTKPAPADQSGTSSAYRYDDTVSKALFNGEASTPGAQIYVNRCAACHRSDGHGYANAFPALAGNAILQTQNPTSAIHIVLSGGAQPPTKTAPSTLTMAPYADILTNQQVADVVTFIQQSWGNQGGTASAAQVAKIRKTAKPVEAAMWPEKRTHQPPAAPSSGGASGALGTTK